VRVFGACTALLGLPVLAAPERVAAGVQVPASAPLRDVPGDRCRVRGGVGAPPALDRLPGGADPHVGQAATWGGGCWLRIRCPSRARVGPAFRARSDGPPPHAGQSTVAAPRGRSAWWCPQPEHAFDAGNHRSTVTTSVTCQPALYLI